MPEKLTKAQRSVLMGKIRSGNTKPERVVRSVLHRMGYRFRLHRRDLPGTPDIVLPRFGMVIQVHGCFWHRHRCKNGRRDPVSNALFWAAKRQRNVERDLRVVRKLRRMGWKVFTVWECHTRDLEKLTDRLRGFLEG